MGLNYKEMDYDSFLKLKTESDLRVEYINGVVYMNASPSTKHQTISGNLYYLLRSYFKNSTCKVFSAPTDVLIKENDEDKGSIVIPDVFVVCNKDTIKANRVEGTPTIVFEILSPSNQSSDTIEKLKKYQDCGVGEYFIVNPFEYSILHYFRVNGSEKFERVVTVHEGSITSTMFSDLVINLDDIFED